MSSAPLLGSVLHSQRVCFKKLHIRKASSGLRNRYAWVAEWVKRQTLDSGSDHKLSVLNQALQKAPCPSFSLSFTVHPPLAPQPISPTPGAHTLYLKKKKKGRKERRKQAIAFGIYRLALVFLACLHSPFLHK